MDIAASGGRASLLNTKIDTWTAVSRRAWTLETSVLEEFRHKYARQFLLRGCVGWERLDIVAL